MNRNTDAHAQNRSPFASDVLVWDAHGCLPLAPGSDVSGLRRYAASGVNFVSINIGMDFNGQSDVIRTLAYFRRWLATHPEEFALVASVDDVLRAKDEGKLAVAFDLEGTEPLDGELDLVSFFYDLGVRQMLMAYNKNSRAGGGCLDEDSGLTEFGRQVIEEMNRVGMLVDCSHAGYRTTMEMMEVSSDPVIFSHSNPRALRDHRRNILDEQIVACARTGGVVGINGVGIFLGENDVRSERVVDHIAYVADLVGPEHVGLGIDYSFDDEEFQEWVRENPEVFPSGDFEFTGFVEPEQTPEIAELLVERGFSQSDVEGIVGGNFLHIARQVWK
jgi:membrane dipeptidase